MSSLLSQIKLSITDLMLDPHNPRFEKSFCDIVTPSGDVWSDKVQRAILGRFSSGEEPTNTDDVTNIKILYESILKTGFQTIDKIVVMRQSEAPGKYLVIEGNRRVASIKTIKEHYDNEIGEFIQSQYRDQKSGLIASFDELPCQLLNTEGLSPSEIHHRVRVILGLRHHGSLLEWSPLPKSKNIYKEYMRQLRDDKFRYSPKKALDVGVKLSISRTKVKESLEAYIAFCQLKKNGAMPKKEHFSLVKEIVTKKALFSHQFLTKDRSSFELDELSLERIESLCVFKNRKKSVLKDPKKVGRLASLVRATQDTKFPVNVRTRAQICLGQLEDGEIDLDTALASITKARRDARWIDELDRLLEEGAATLSPEGFMGAGNDLKEKKKVEFMLNALSRLSSFRG